MNIKKFARARSSKTKSSKTKIGTDHVLSVTTKIMSARDSSDLDTSAYIYWLASVEVHQLGLAYEVVDPT